MKDPPPVTDVCLQTVLFSWFYFRFDQEAFSHLICKDAVVRRVAWLLALR